MSIEQFCQLVDANERWLLYVKEYTMFEPITDEAEIHDIEANARVRGAVSAFLQNLKEFYEGYADKEERKFMLYLNKNETDPFYLKKTDSLYSNMLPQLKKAEMDKEWRLVKSNGHLLIAHV
jgi:hypothetical protein